VGCILSPLRGWSVELLDLKPGYENLGVLAADDLRAVGGFKEQLDCFLQILPGRLDGVALACDTNFGAEADIAVTFPFNDSGELLYVLHSAYC
jgi:hypothetical protein